MDWACILGLRLRRVKGHPSRLERPFLVQDLQDCFVEMGNFDTNQEITYLILLKDFKVLGLKLPNGPAKSFLQD